MAAADTIYFKKNVAFSVGVRMFLRDTEGVVLNAANPFVGVPSEDVKDFKRANKYALENGLIVETPEPESDFDITPNAITDEEANELVKNLFSLRKRLPEITSEATLGKLYAAAVSQKRSQKIIEMIKDRIDDVTPAGMRGIDWGAEERDEDSGGE